MSHADHQGLTLPGYKLSKRLGAGGYGEVWLAHAPGGFFPILNGGELAALYCFVFLYLSAAGAGPWSVDAARNR